MHIYINKETEELLIKLASSGIYKKNTASYVLKYLVEKEIKYTENTLRNIEEQRKKEEQIKQKFGSIEKVIEIAQQDWTITDNDDEHEEIEEDWVTKQEKEYKKRLLEEEQNTQIEEEHEEDWNTLEAEIQKWKEKRKNEKTNN